MELIKTVISYAAILVAIMAGTIALGGPGKPEPLVGIGNAFEDVDYSDMPQSQQFTARDGTPLSYRRYPGDADSKRIVITLHGSAGSSTSLHPLAGALSRAGLAVIAPDIRGHGASGRRGDVDYIGQTDDDLTDLIEHLRTTTPDAAISLVGFSMGGGIALRFAAQRDDLEQVVLIAPYLAHDAEPMRAKNPNAPEVPWSKAGVTRIIGLSMLNSFGIRALNGLTTVRLAVREGDRDRLADSYTYRLMQSVNPVVWQRDLAAISDRLTLIAGGRDGLHLASAYGEALAKYAPGAAFITVPEVDHIGLTLDPAALTTLTTTILEN